MMRTAIVLAIWVLLLGSTAPQAAAEEARPTAIFPVELLDSSGEGAKPGQTERLKLVTGLLSEGLAKTGKYAPVDLAPFAAEVADMQPRYTCDGCWRKVTKDAGAELAVIAVVRKVSTLVSTISIWIEDVETKSFVEVAQAQFRGETDEAYTRAIQFLLKNRLAKQS